MYYILLKLFGILALITAQMTNATLMKFAKKCFWGLLSLFLFISCQSNEDLPPPNIIWLNCEDLSPILGAYGDPYAKTPHIDQLAKEGILFTHAYASAPICAPSRSCMVTGVYATSLGTQHLRSTLKRPEFVKTVPEYLQQAGYFTTNYAKTDYNFDPSGMYDYWQKDMAPWRQRAENDASPFFSFFVFGLTHEGSGNKHENYLRSVANMPDSLFHDPEKAPVPPYYPDTPEFRELWAHYYDTSSAFDHEVGKIIQLLKEDDLYDNTIIILYSDHGHGMPRFKRWLNHSGLHVPFIVYVPKKYQHLAKQTPGSQNNQLVNFSDLAPTTLSLAGLPIPDYMQGIPFMGTQVGEERTYMAAARSRADNMYEVSRAIRDDRYIYIRHYLPHLPYIQAGHIFSDVKLSLKYLRAMHEEGTLPAESEKMWNPKPVEELYDLQNDPQELTNLADQENYKEKKEELRNALHEWMLDTRDAGLLFEPEMMIRGEASTVYEMAQDPTRYDLPSILETAEMVGMANLEELVEKLEDDDSGVRFWAAMGIQALGQQAEPASNELKKRLSDPSPSVAIVAAETLCQLDNCNQEEIETLERYLKDERPWVALQASRAIELLEDHACSFIPAMYEVLENNKKPEGRTTGHAHYKDFNFAAFTSWSLKWALANCGEDIDITY